MSEVKWIKLTTTMFDDERLRLIEVLSNGDSNLMLWLKLLFIAGEKNRGGVVFRFELKKRVTVSDQQLTDFLSLCNNFGMITLWNKGSVNESIHINEPDYWYKIDRDCVIDEDNWRVTRMYVLERDNYTCQYCGNNTGPLEVDHVMPRCRGGLSAEENLVCACFTCNRSKGGRTPEEWRGN